jgi:hypothetical protein
MPPLSPYTYSRAELARRWGVHAWETATQIECATRSKQRLEKSAAAIQQV